MPGDIQRAPESRQLAPRRPEPLDREEPHLVPQSQHGELPEPEHRRRVETEGRGRDREIHRPAGAGSRQDAEQKAERGRNDERGEGEEQRAGHALENHRHRRTSRGVRGADVAGQEPRPEGDKLLGQRTVQPEALPHEAVVARIAMLSGHGQHGIAGREMNQGETDQDDGERGGNEEQETPGDEPPHHRSQRALAAKWAARPNPWHRVR